ncbi:TPA: phage tail protein [Pluralibacter gergoviae]|uniref:phage tail protein n=1 Tax=Pluralibacter gergoviae TaxID=61647 RepID=UPI001925275A|nr:phage tail protein [Pluralibacter gergoviae]MBL3694166.1 phage tail protein [Pluralibacter gergoviae]HDS1149642.1 phage tail protein [Pluralibacter gergoviae]
MGLKGLEQVIANLNSLDRNMVPNASVWAINRVAASAISRAVRVVAREAVAGDNRVKGIPVRIVRQRVRLSKASTSGKKCRIRVNRGNLPAKKLGAVQVRLTRKKGRLLKKGSVLKVGRYLFRDAFLQQLANGRWQIMRRVNGKSRYPIDVVKVPLVEPLTAAFEQEKKRMLDEDMPKQLTAALRQQLRLYFKR